jgi:hypothetical protein
MAAILPPFLNLLRSDTPKRAGRFADLRSISPKRAVSLVVQAGLRRGNPGECLTGGGARFQWRQGLRAIPRRLKKRVTSPTRRAPRGGESGEICCRINSIHVASP